MPSPFPGMDPWLELPGIFPDLHLRLIYLMSELLNQSMPPNYVANSANRVWVNDEQLREPDVSLLSSGDRPRGTFETGAFVHEGMVAVLAEPIPDPWEEPYIEIYSNGGDRLVTAIEVLSRSNKASGDPGRASYLQKQQEYRLGGVNIVEIDLLRGGKHVTLIPHNQLQHVTKDYDYHTCVTVIDDPTKYYVKPFKIFDRMPTIVVPLDPGVAPVKVDLQPLLDRAYDSGRYSMLARYSSRTCDPALTPEQQVWAETILREKGLLKSQ